MSQLGQVCIGHKAPDFHCEAVVGGAIKEVSLSTFIRPSASPGSPDPDAPWLLLLFIPAAFSFVCPTEVIAFQNCYDEFKDRNCDIAFVSVDTKHSLWHWQNVPRQYGGLGNIDIPLLSDATHKIGRDYGVLVEEEGVSLRGMFIIDNDGLVQQITLNNLTVGRSVLEALRLLEAFQAVAKHGVLCPIDWRPSSHASDTLSTISNTLVESYEDRLANLQKEFGDVQVTDLDAKHRKIARVDSIPHAEFVDTRGPKVELSPIYSTHITSQVAADARDPPPSPGHTSCSARVSVQSQEMNSQESDQPNKSGPPSPATAVATPVVTPSAQDPPSLKPRTLERSTARHSRGKALHEDINKMFSFTDASLFYVSPYFESSSSHQKPPLSPLRRPQHPNLHPNMYESQRGSHVMLEFADPTLSPMVSPSREVTATRPRITHYASSPPLPSPAMSRRGVPSLSRATSWSGVLKREGSSGSRLDMTPSPNDGTNSSFGHTRLQATFMALKKMSAGLASPRIDNTPNKQKDENGRTPGYFDVTAEE
ncbi:AhpC/TSA family protein [Stagonosporopsis vannaccii]|nr:AhpC/TSA family protein [Stagonosporopsis vannaccii]